LSLYPKIPIILVSANLPSEVQARVESLATRIIEKPFNIADLVRSASKLLDWSARDLTD
jgi:CheY-like chemotaxis protein